MLSDIRPAIVSTILFTLLLGLGYPLAITGIAQVGLPLPGERQPGDRQGRPRDRLGPARPALRQGRVPAPAPVGGRQRLRPDQLGRLQLRPAEPRPRQADRRRRRRRCASRPASQEIPDDAITTSGSGLDPDISPAYADLQADRIAKARGASVDAVRKLIDAHVDGPFLGFIGQPHVNVLMTNRALDAAIPKAQPKPA